MEETYAEFTRDMTFPDAAKFGILEDGRVL
jgi:hypothetical protein